MSDPEFNKIFAAVLLAGITVWTTWFIAGKLVHPYYPDENAVFIEGTDVVASGAPAKPAGPDPILHLIATADIARGEKLSKACAACHSFDKGGPNKVGPNMWDTVGNTKAHIDSFAYSDALASMEGEWDYLALNKFLWKPKEYVPGTKMNYIGLRKAEDRAALIAWMRTLADSPAALPSDAEIAAELAELAPPEPEEEEVVTDLETEEELKSAVAGE